MTTDQHQQRTVTLGADFGGGAIKIYGPLGGIELPAHAASAYKRGRQAKVTGFRAMKPPMRILMEGGAFYVGLGAHDWGRPIENLGDERFTGSPELRALVYGALSQYIMTYGSIGNSRDTVEMIAGLTQSTFARTTASSLVSAVKGWLSGEHAWTVETGTSSSGKRQHMLTVSNTSVTSQAAGAVFDHFLNAGGEYVTQRKPFFQKEVGIISIGMNTLEMLVLRNGIPIERFTHSETAGVRRLLELVDPTGLYSRGELDTRLRTRHLDVRNSLPVWAAEVSGHIERRWGAAVNRFQTILLVGGGALLLKHSLKLNSLDLKNIATIPDDPIMSVSKGLYKMGLMRLRNRT